MKGSVNILLFVAAMLAFSQKSIFGFEGYQVKSSQK
jgi:hypothetical protein